MKNMIFAAVIVLLVAFSGARELLASTENSITTWRGNHPAAVSLTFDDNYSTQYTVALPELNARGFRGTFFVITSSANWEWYVEAANAGHEIAAHTVTHPYLTKLSSSNAESEIAASQATINEKVPSQKCVTFAYPYGDVDSTVEALVAKYYIGARGVDTSTNDLFNEVSNDVSIKTVAQMQGLTDQAVSQRSWLIPMFHSFDPTQYGKWTPDMFLTYMDYLQARTDLWIAPFGEVIKYIRERSATTISASSTGSSITLNLTHDLDPAVFNYPLTVRSVVPVAWAIVNVQQGGKVTALAPVTDQGQWVVYYDAVPNGGDITLTQGTSPPVALTALAVIPTGVAGGASAQGTVTLSGPAPSDGVVVSLRSNSSAATVPTSVTVPSGNTSATFTITTTAVSSSTNVTISAAYGAVTRTATLNVAASGSPTVAISTPVNGTSFNAPATIPISATATAGARATISKVDFYAGAVLLGTATTDPYTVTWSSVAAGGYVITAKATDSLGRTATSSVSISVNNNATLPQPWATQDVGGVGVAGNATLQDGIFSLKGAGYDIWGDVDFFRYAYRPLTGDGQVIARVTSLQNTDPYAKGGVMIRETLADNSAHAMMVLTPANGARFAWRPTAGETMPGSIAMANVAPPYWVRVVRSANTFTGYVSKDGVAWTRVGSSTVAMPSSVYVGLVVTSHNNTTLCSSTMDGVSVTGASPASPTVSISAPANGTSYDTAPAALLITATAMPGMGATVSRVDFFAGTTLVGTATSGPYSVTWGSASAGNYSLTAKITDSLGGTATSSPVSISVATSGLPTVIISAPVDGTSYNAPATIPISAAATAGTGAKISKVEFYAGPTLVGTATASPYSVTWNSVAAGGYSLTAKVTDSHGETATSSPVSISVIPSVPPTVAITAPVEGMSYSAPATITISATATAGTTATISKVEFYAGNLLLGTATTLPYSVTWNSVAAGSYSLTAKVTDSLGATATSTPVAVTVTAAVPPTVAFTAPTAETSYTAPATIPISATATAGTGATISKVEFYAGTTLVGTATTPPYSITWSSVAAGSYSLTATVTDSLGGTATSSPVLITVIPSASPTVAITAPPAETSYSAPATIPISATATPGTGATISKVEFYAGTTLVGTAATAPYSVTWSSVAAGSYSLTAKVTDSLGGTATSTSINVSVTAAVPPAVAITAPLNGASYIAPATVPISASATAGNGATITKVEFYAGTELVGTTTTAPFSVTWSSVAAGSYSLTAKVTDSLGGTATSSPVSISVTTTIPPTVAITAPVNATSYIAPATIPISATATAGTGATISKVEFYAGTELVGTAITAPFSVTWSSVPAGNYSLTAKVTDSLGATATSSPVAVTVTAAVPPAVAITAPINGTSYSAPATIPITATATAGTGAIITKVEFYAGTTLVGTATTAPYSVTWSSVAAGSYSLTAKVTDSLGATATSSPVAVTVTAPVPPTVAIIKPVTGTSFGAPATIPITATATAGSGATISKVDFYSGTTLVGTAIAAPYTVTWKKVVAGSYTLTAKVTDTLNATATSAPVVITVTDKRPGRP